MCADVLGGPVFVLDPPISHSMNSAKIVQKINMATTAPKVRSKYFTPNEVLHHNCQTDCWVSLLGYVYDLTPLIAKNTASPLIDPIIKFAGEDISHWFDPKTRDVKRRIDPVTNLEGYFLPMGRFLHVPAPSISKRFDGEEPTQLPWWKDDKYVIGKLSMKTRTIRIINTLTRHDHLLEVCQEETLEEILARYLQNNTHAASYTWKRLGKKLAMNLTLQENGIEDEDAEFEELGIRDDYYIPAIHLYFNDDLTVQ